MSTDAPGFPSASKLANVDSGFVFGGRMKGRRNNVYQYRKVWKDLTDYHGTLCYYCKKEVATSIDHVIPHSYDQDNSLDNLVPACSMCNLLASDKHFETVEQKRQYILKKRQARANQIVICSECMLPFTYRVHSPSLFLCAECYDQEYDTDFSKSLTWQKWIGLLWSAGMPAEAHRAMKKRLDTGRGVTNRVRLETLVDEYANVISSNEEFAELLIRA